MSQLGTGPPTGHDEGKAVPERNSGEDEGQALISLVGSIPSTDPEYGQWWSTQDGWELYAMILRRIGTPIAISVNRQYGVSYEAEDIANTAFLVMRQDFVAAYLSRSTDPWAYLASVLKREMVRTAGSHFRTELTDEVLYVQDALPWTPSITVGEAAMLTAHALSSAATALREDVLLEAVLYFAERGHQRISHLYTNATADPELTALGLGREEILAIANAVLGSRPDNQLNSLIAAFLTDPAFDPKSSIRHRRALNKFTARITKAHHQEMRQLVG